MTATAPLEEWVAVAEPVPVPVPVGALLGAAVVVVANAVAAYNAVDWYVWHADGVGAGCCKGSSVREIREDL